MTVHWHNAGFRQKGNRALLGRVSAQHRRQHTDMESLLDISSPVCIMEYGKQTFLLDKRGEPMKNRLEEIRKSRGIKQEELASALEVSRQTIGSLENGRYNPSILLAFKIARYFDMRIEDIFIYEEGTA